MKTNIKGRGILLKEKQYDSPLKGFLKASQIMEYEERKNC